MALKEYKSRRRFARTPEPRPTRLGRAKPKTVKSGGTLHFVVQKHAASHLHYDFRLEMHGVLKSWAVPKSIPRSFGIKRLAVQTEDHPLAYAKFKGVIPKGEYGAGKVEIWDKGTYKMIEHTPVSYKFKLHGKKLTGIYVLYKFGQTLRPRSGRAGLSPRSDKNWFLFKSHH